MKMCLKKAGVCGYSGKNKAELEKMCKDHKCMPMMEKSPKFIQKVMSAPGYRKGAMTMKAKKHGMTALGYAMDVVKHPEGHDVRTRKQAQFLMNIQKK